MTDIVMKRMLPWMRKTRMKMCFPRIMLCYPRMMLPWMKIRMKQKGMKMFFPRIMLCYPRMMLPWMRKIRMKQKRKMTCFTRTIHYSRAVVISVGAVVIQLKNIKQYMMPCFPRMVPCFHRAVIILLLNIT